MRKIDYSYKEMEKEMKEKIANLCVEGERAQRGVLATSANDFVTARKMGFIPDGLKLYGWTNRTSRKHQQIMANPNVSVVVDFVQIEGIANLKRHPMDEPEFLELYKKNLPDDYERSIKDWRESDQLVIEVVPKRIALYDVKGDENGAYLDILNIDKGTAFRFYDHKVWSENEDTKAYWE